MFRIFFFLLVIAAVSYGLSLVADVDGKLIIQWPGGEIQPTLMQAVIAMAVLVFALITAWTLFRMVLTSPEMFSSYFRRKKAEKGLAALSGGLIALGAGDKSGAARLASQARKTLPNDPMTLMLRAQAAELAGDTAKASRLYESMLASSDTEIMGLRGLYLLALEQKAFEPAEQYAGRAVKRRQDLQWAVMGLFDLQTKSEKWAAALETLKIAQSNRHLEGKKAKRYRAVLLTALAQKLEDHKPDTALEFAKEAISLAPTLVPAAVVAGRIYASQGHMTQALTLLRRCWKNAPHPDIAFVSAHARPGDSVRDRLRRIQSLADLTPGHREAALAVARAAMEAKDWGLARSSLGPLVRGTPSQQVSTLMARIEAEETGNKGLVREWLSRAVTARPDPQWMADGKTFDEWAPVSPLSGKLDAFTWSVPEAAEFNDTDTVSLKQMISGLLTAESLDAPTLPEVSDVKLSEFEPSVDIVEDVSLDVDEGEIIPSDEGPQTDVKPVTDVKGETTESDGEEAKEPESKAVPEPEVISSPEKEGGVAGNVEKAERDEKRQETTNKRKKRRRKSRHRTKIFVSPPAPDDPGIDVEDGGDTAGFAKNLRPVRY